MDEALEDLRIVDFSRVLAGPLATMILADLGASVTKVERPGAGDDTRAWGPPHDADGMATYFQAVNRNKRSVVLDLRDAADVERARGLVAAADVVVENFRPGLMDDIGLGYDALHAESPALVYCSITGFGTATASAAALPGYDLLVQALGGLMSITGTPDGEPQKVGVALVDVICGLFALGRFLQIGGAGDPQFLVQQLDPLGAQPYQVQQERQGRRGLRLQLLAQAQVPGGNNLPDLARQVLAHPGKPGKILALGRQIRQALGHVSHHPGRVAISPHPEGVGTLDLQQIRHLLENVGDVLVVDRHGQSGCRRRLGYFLQLSGWGGISLEVIART